MPNNIVKGMRYKLMSWKRKFTDHIADVLRFAAYVFLAFDAVVLSIFLFWFIVKFTWNLSKYINFHIFEVPWY